ncbi:MAG: M1 family aminopeptidase/hydrolase, partial [Sphingomonadaceae bacterium]
MPMFPRLALPSLAIACAAALAACNPAEPERDEAGKAPPREERMVADILPEADDVHSYAEPGEARVTHVALDLVADFEEKLLEGTAMLDIEAAEDAEEIVLDTKGLDIRAVHNGKDVPLEWELGEEDEILGRPLTVELAGAERIEVDYATAPDAAALQWLAPEQTAGGEHPFMFSQGQAILNRTWIPTQDSPGIRQTWEAEISVPQELRAVMSAAALNPEGEPADEEGMTAYRFEMDKPVAPYLIALAVGDIAFQKLGPRSGVYAEPSMLKEAAYELADVEKMIDAAEELYGPYRWGRYDMIVLPPAFPYGGMENPMLTFLTPTMIAGDRSLVALMAHELAHSWSGNLVTNATWSDFWLNEGFTTYFEGRIMEKLYGRERAEMLIEEGWEGLEEEIEDMGGEDAPASRRKQLLSTRPPPQRPSPDAKKKWPRLHRPQQPPSGPPRHNQNN